MTRPDVRRRDDRVRKAVPFLAISLIYLFTEALCFIGLLVLRGFGIPYDPNISALSADQQTSLRKFLRQQGGQYIAQDSVLGWVATAEANSAGMRDNREYARVPLPGTLRISAFGDSFTYGADVALRDTWAKQLTAIDPSIEVLNYGTGAYGLDQAYLRYLKVGTDYKPHVVFIGYMSENLARNVNVFRAFYTSNYRNTIFTKPRFKVRDGELVLLENPIADLRDHEYFLFNDREVLPKLGKNDYHYQTSYNRGALDFLPSMRLAKVVWSAVNREIVNPIFTLDGMYNVESEAYEVTTKIFDAFYGKVREDGALPVIIIFSDLNDQWRSREKKERRYSPLLRYFRSKGYRYIDTLEALEPYEARYSVDDLVEEWGHYSALGHRIIAEFIYGELQKWGLGN
jgi:hypothetical protein